MKKQIKINPATRKFIAQRKLVNSGRFEPEFLKKKPPIFDEKSVDPVISKGWLKSLSNFISLIMANTPETFAKGGILFTQILSNGVTAVQQNFTFSTPAGGRNVLITEKVTEGQDILMMCNTTKLNVNVTANITSLITKLCDGSMILALNGTNPLLNTTTDPSLKCIENKFDSSCESPTNDTLYLMLAAGIGIALSACCGCYTAYKCCNRSQPRLDQRPLIYPSRQPSEKSSIVISPIIDTHTKLCC